MLQYLYDLRLVWPPEKSSRPSWLIAALVSWGIALFENLLQVPANRIGHQAMNVGQLKILQEVVTLTIFVPFSLFYLREKMDLDYLWAACCLLGAVFSCFAANCWGFEQAKVESW